MRFQSAFWSGTEDFLHKKQKKQAATLNKDYSFFPSPPIYFPWTDATASYPAEYSSQFEELTIANKKNRVELKLVHSWKDEQYQFRTTHLFSSRQKEKSLVPQG